MLKNPEAVFAVPHSCAFVIDKKDAHILSQKNTSVLESLRRIRQIEEKNGNAEKAGKLDEQIAKIQNENHAGMAREMQKTTL